jgi:hypothetical protein
MSNMHIKFIRIYFYLFFLITCTPSQSQTYKVYAQAGSYGSPPYAIYNDETNTNLTGFVFHRAKIIEDQFFVVHYEDETVQILTTDLKKLLPEKKYSNASISLENTSFASVVAIVPNPNDNVFPKYGIYDIKNKKEVIGKKYSYIGKINKNGIAPFNKGGKDLMPQLVQGGKWGYVKVDGTELTPAKFTWCSNLNNNNIGKVYIGGNSNDGLYGGYWSLVNEKGKYVIDDKLYYAEEGDYYSTAPYCEEEIFLKSGSHKGSIYYNCNDNSVSKSDYYILGEITSLEFKIVSKEPKSLFGDNLKGVINNKRELVLPIVYKSIRLIATQLLMEDENENAFFYNPSDGKIIDLKLENIRVLSKSLYPQFEKEKVNMVIIGENSKGKIDLLDENFNHIISDIDAPYYHGYDQDYYTLHNYKSFGDLFGYTKDGKINYYSLDLKKNILPEGIQALSENVANFLNGSLSDSLFIKKNEKWGLVHPTSFHGNDFIYDSLSYLGDDFIVAHQNNVCVLYVNGKRATNFPVFDKLISNANTGRYIPREVRRYQPYKQLLINYKKTNYLIQFSKYFSFYDSFDSFVLDKGNITSLKLSMYEKDGNPYLLFSKKQLPKGTISCSGLDDWTSKSDIPIYNYRIGDLYGIIDENGKIIFEPKYPVKDYVTTYPPDGFDYKVE